MGSPYRSSCPVMVGLGGLESLMRLEGWLLMEVLEEGTWNYDWSAG